MYAIFGVVGHNIELQRHCEKFIPKFVIVPFNRCKIFSELTKVFSKLEMSRRSEKVVCFWCCWIIFYCKIWIINPLKTGKVEEAFFEWWQTRTERFKSYSRFDIVIPFSRFPRFPKFRPGLSKRSKPKRFVRSKSRKSIS